MNKLYIKDILKLKNQRRIVKTTALDFFTAKIVEEAKVDIIGLDGPPIEIYFKGMTDGTCAKLKELYLSLNAIRRGAPNTLIACPIPFGYASISMKDTIKTAIEIIKNGADLIIIEGGESSFKKINKIIKEGIPCAGHIGLTFIEAKNNGFRSVGKNALEAYDIYRNAIKLQDLEVTWIELECVPYKIAEQITKRLKIPTIGVGSGSFCDGQFLHIEDILGMHDRYYPKHSKKYSNFYENSVDSVKKFVQEVYSETFPEKSNSFEIEESEFKKFIEKVK